MNEISDEDIVRIRESLNEYEEQNKNNRFEEYVSRFIESIARGFTGISVKS